MKKIRGHAVEENDFLEVYTPDPVFEKSIIDVVDLADWLGISTKTVYKMIKSGKLHPIKIGRQYRFIVSDLIKKIKEEIYV